MTPIIIEQTTLIKFFPFLRTRRGRCGKITATNPPVTPIYKAVLEPNNEVRIKETHCLICGSRLLKNGWNTRVLIFEKRRERSNVRLMRKCCPKCGEISPDLSKIAPKNGIYHDKFKRMARQHYMEGLMPSQIKRVFKIDFGIDISKSSIVNWINEAAKPLRMLLKGTPVPSSGYWGYDEIHMKIAGKKRYTIDTVDINTKFVPVARISENMGRGAGGKVIKEGRRGNTIKLKGLVKDCSTNLGGLFRLKAFRTTKQQNCITHVKWIMARHVKGYVGIPQGSIKPLPKKWNWFLKLFYNVIDSKNETEIYINLEILRNAINQLSEKRINRLVKAFKQLEKWIPKLLAHQRDPFLPSTNNLLESYHKKYNYYPSFKKSMMTEHGAQRILDYRVFRHNFRRFPEYIRQYELKRERWRALLPEMKGDTIFEGQAKHFSSFIKNINRWYGEYQDVWEEFFSISRE